MLESFSAESFYSWWQHVSEAEFELYSDKVNKVICVLPHVASL